MDKLFYPESVAVFGASSKPTNIGRNIILNMQNWEYTGEIYPVNPRGEEVLGCSGYSSLEEIPGKVDLVVAFVPAGAVPGILDQCGRKGVRDVAIPSGGFAELGEEGEALTALLKQKAAEHQIRFVGPNGLTVINAENGLCLPFLPMKKRSPGRISIISQSGGVGLSLIMFLDNAGRSFNKFISIGNKVDLDEVDFLEYLGSDPGTRVICLFLESMARGDRFMEVAARIDKPIIVYKANTTEVGARTARSHTAALANNDAVLTCALEQVGVTRVDSIRKLIRMAVAFELPPMKGDRIAVVSQAGGYTVLMSDEACKRDFTFPPLSGKLLEGFKDHVRADVIKMGNPLDLGDILSTDAILYALEGLVAQDDIDGVVSAILRRSDAVYDGAYEALSREMWPDIGEIIKKYEKPIALCLLSQCEYSADVQRRMDFPVFETPEEAIEAIAILRDHHRSCTRGTSSRGSATATYRRPRT